MTFWKWSRTASANATADSTCPFPEGMAPSAVNDGVRGLMAAAAKYRDDISGALYTSGTSSALALASYQGMVSPVSDGQGIAFFMNTPTNVQGVTLNVDGTGAFPIQTQAGGILPLPAGVLIQGGIYRVRYSTNPVSMWVLDSFFNPIYSVPIGGFLPYLSTTPPNSSFVLPFGQPINRSTYATLFAMIGTTFGVGDGSTTFNIPDLRGRAIFGLDNMGGAAAGRVTGASGISGTVIGATGGVEAVVLSTAQMPSHAHGGVTGSMNRNNPHSHTFVQDSYAGGPGDSAFAPVAKSTFTANTGIADINHEHGIAAEGGNQAHSNMPPSIILPVLLRVI